MPTSIQLFLFAVSCVGIFAQPGYGGDVVSFPPEEWNSTETFVGGCQVGVMIGSGWSNASTGGEYFVVYLEFSSEGGVIPLSRPWTLTVESPAYIKLDEYWNIQLKEFHDGFIEGIVHGPWGHDISGQAKIIDVGFIVLGQANEADKNWKIPHLVTANGHVCELHEISR